MSSQHEPDDELVTRATQGDRQAARQLLERHRERLLRMVCVWLEQEAVPRIDPGELVKRTMDAALEQLVSGPPVQSGQVLLWLRKCATGELSRLRQAVGEGSESVPRPAEPRLLAEPAAERLAQELLSENSATLGRLLKKELRRQLAAVLARLGRTDRELLLLRHLEGLSVAECAAVLGISEETLKVRYVEVLERLKRLLSDQSSHVDRQ